MVSERDRDKLVLFVHGELDQLEAQRLAARFSSEEDLRLEYEALLSTNDALEDLFLVPAKEELSPEQVNRAINRVRNETRPASRRRIFYAASGAALAASLALVLWTKQSELKERRFSAPAPMAAVDDPSAQRQRVVEEKKSVQSAPSVPSETVALDAAKESAAPPPSAFAKNDEGAAKPSAAEAEAWQDQKVIESKSEVAAADSLSKKAEVARHNSESIAPSSDSVGTAGGAEPATGDSSVAAAGASASGRTTSVASRENAGPRANIAAKPSVAGLARRADTPAAPTLAAKESANTSAVMNGPAKLRASSKKSKDVQADRVAEAPQKGFGVRSEPMALTQSNAVEPAEWFACEAASDCVLVEDSCDLRAINRKFVKVFQDSRRGKSNSCETPNSDPASRSKHKAICKASRCVRE